MTDAVKKTNKLKTVTIHDIGLSGFGGPLAISGNVEFQFEPSPGYQAGPVVQVLVGVPMDEKDTMLDATRSLREHAMAVVRRLAEISTDDVLSTPPEQA